MRRIESRPGQAVGYGSNFAIGTHALIQTIADSYIHLNPPGFRSSIANGTSGATSRNHTTDCELPAVDATLGLFELGQGRQPCYGRDVANFVGVMPARSSSI